MLKDIVTLLAENAKLRIENTKLRKIIEQNDLCHNLHGEVDARAFADGCAQEQYKEYGCAPDADAVISLRLQLREALLTQRLVRICDICDHGVIGGSPCETCAGSGYVTIMEKF